MANFLPEYWINEVRSNNDIVDVVSEYLVLKPSGKGFFGLCPFHNERTASFHVNAEMQMYHCFGCGVGGNVISFIMAIERLEFVEAVKYLADRAGMPLLDTVDSEQYKKAKDERQHLYEINKDVAKYYYEKLISADGQQAIDYLKSRGLDITTIKAFGLGYAPDGWENIKEYLIGKQYEIDVLIKLGIVVENNQRTYDRFRNRIMFPIINTTGMVVGFGGRIMDDTLPKYLNSSDSPIFNKSNTLFGINLIRKQLPVDSIIIVEGYMDVITLYQFGIRNAVASLGTALTNNQAKLIRRYANEVYIAYDGDTAGQKATQRGLDILQEAGCKVKVMQFPKGMDPDDTIRKYGVEFFNKLKDQASSLVDYKLDQLLKDYDLDKQDGRVGYATAAANILGKVTNLLERDAHIQRLETVTGFASRIIYQQIEHFKSEKDMSGVKQYKTGNNKHVAHLNKQKLLLPGHIKAEKHLIYLMSLSNENAKKILDGMAGQEFSVELHRDIAEIIKKLLGQGYDINPAQILNYAKEQEKAQQMVEIFNLQIEYDNKDKFISDCLQELTLNRLENQRQELKREITEMDRSGISDPDRYRWLLQEINSINQRIKFSN